MNPIDRSRLHLLLKREEQKYLEDHPKSHELFERACQSMQAGVPMLWMIRWAGTFPLFVKEAKGAHFIDVDDRSYIDFCLGDTGAMTGHSPDASIKAIRKQAGNGLTLMLPAEDSVRVGEELQRRFGVKYWQFTLIGHRRQPVRHSNKPRHITGRPRILVFNSCYHGSVDETFITLDEEGYSRPSRRGNLGPPVNPVETTKVIRI